MGKYQKNVREYDSEETILDCIGRAAKQVLSKLVYWVLVVYYALQSSALPKRDKLKIIAALAYLIFPLDVLPDTIPVVGVIDDALVLWAVFRLLVVVDKDIKAQAMDKMQQMLNR